MRNKGFSLIELVMAMAIISVVAALGIIGILAAYIAPKFINRTEDARVSNRTEDARVNSAKAQIRALEAGLKMFWLDNGFYPTTDQGLEALVTMPTTGRVPEDYKTGGYIESSSVPLDPWNNEYIYESPGSNGVDYEIESLGADGVEGGENEKADIESWNFN